MTSPMVLRPLCVDGVTTGSGGQTTFRCPRCGAEYARCLLARRWSEWGQICWCPESGVFNPSCTVFAEHPTASTPEMPCPR